MTAVKLSRMTLYCGLRQYVRLLRQRSSKNCVPNGCACRLSKCRGVEPGAGCNALDTALSTILGVWSTNSGQNPMVNQQRSVTYACHCAGTRQPRLGRAALLLLEKSLPASKMQGWCLPGTVGPAGGFQCVGGWFPVCVKVVSSVCQ